MRAARAAVVAQLASVSFACRPDSALWDNDACKMGWSILDEIRSQDTHWLLIDLMRQEHIDILNGPGPFTLFNHDEQDFVEAGICTEYPYNCSMPPDHLTDFLMYHIVEGNFTVADLREGQVLKTMFTGHEITVQSINGQSEGNFTVTLRSEDGKETTFTGGGSECTNGVIHQGYNTGVLIPDPHWDPYCDCRVVPPFNQEPCSSILDDGTACYENCCGDPHATFV